MLDAVFAPGPRAHVRAHDLPDRVDDRDSPEHDRDREPQRAVRRPDREVRADARARDHRDAQRERERPVDVAEQLRA